MLTTREPAVCSRAGRARPVLAAPHRGAAPPAAALPPFTAVAPGPIPAELHPGSSLQSPQASHCLGLVSEQSLRYFFCSPTDGEQGKGKEKTSPRSPCHITACPSLPIQCIRSFIVIRPNKSFADGCRSFCPETFPSSLPLLLRSVTILTKQKTPNST